MSRRNLRFAAPAVSKLGCNAFASLACALLLLASPLLQAAPGTLDPAFGTGGIARLVGKRGEDSARAVAADSQGRVVLVGDADQGFDTSIAVTRHRTDGSLDPAFNGTGVRFIPAASGSSVGYGVAIDASGRILVAGYADGGLLVARLLSDGSLDPAFGSGGIATGLVPNMAGLAMALDSSGRIVVAGAFGYEFRIARLTDAGALDTTLGGTGTVTTSVGTGEENPHAIAIDATGRIVVAGFARNGPNYDIAVARFLPTGALDSAFNGTGKFVGPGNNEGATSVAIDGAGRIVLAGPAFSGAQTFRVARLTAAGAYDASFGTGGRVSTAFVYADFARSVAIDGAGRIVVAGSAGAGLGYAPAFARYLQSGALDPAFGIGGKVTAAEAGKSFLTYAMALDAGGRIVCAGSATFLAIGSSNDFGVIRRLADGAPDTTFAGGSIVATGLAVSGGELTALARGRDGKVVFAGGLYDGSPSYQDFMVGRLNADGTPDESFGPSGIRVTKFANGNSRATAVAVDSAGRIVVAGDSRNDSFLQVVTVQRFLPNGSLDPVFGSGGTSRTVTDTSSLQVNAVAIDAFDRIVVGGQKFGDSSTDMMVIRLTTQGALDATFGSGGVTLVDFVSASDFGSSLVIDAAGRIVVAGSSGNSMAVARLTGTGALDATFNATGQATVAPVAGASSTFAAAVAVDSLGRVVLAGDSVAGATTESVVRLTATGVLDTSFNGTGRVVLAPGGGGSRAWAVAVDSSNRPVTAGQVFGASYQTSLRRLTEGGLADATFAGTGSMLVSISPTSSQSVGFAVAVFPEGRLLAGGVSYVTNPPEMFVLRAFGEESPAAFAFASQSGVPLSTTVTSNTVTVSGVGGLVPVSVDGGEYSVGCGGTFTNAPGVVVNSTTLCVRHRASGLPNAATVTKLVVGTTSAFFTSTTGKSASAVSVGSGSNPSVAGASVTFTASVLGLYGTPTGTVNFKADGVALGAASLNASGTAQLATTMLVSGARSITAEYGGDASYLAAVSPGYPQTVQPLATVARPRGDFSGDRKADLVWRDAAGGLALWTMEGTAISSTFFGVVGTEWQIADVGDANGDGKADLFWWNATLGSGYLWFLNGTAITGFADLGILGPDWNLVGSADFNGDGKSDLLFRRSTDGFLYIWLMDGGGIASQGSPGTVASPWQIMDLADFDGDGKADIVFRNTADGGVTIWKMNGIAFDSNTYVGAVDAGFWRIVAAADFNADGKADLLWLGDDGDLWVWLMNGAAITSAGALGNAGPGWSVSAVSDFTGDGKADIVWRFVDGTTYLWRVDGVQVAGMAQIANPGGSWRIVAP